MLILDTGTEAAGEQGDYYDPLFTYKEGDEVSYFVISDEFEGGATDVGPSGAGGDKESPMASSSRGWVAEPLASEGKPDIPAMEAFRTDKVLLEIAFVASPVTARVSSMEPVGVSTVVKEDPMEVVVEAVGAMPIMNSTPLGEVIVIYK